MKNFYNKNFFLIFNLIGDWGLGIGDWGLGIGDWAQSPIPNPQSPIPIFIIKVFHSYDTIIIKKYKKKNI